MDKEWIRTDQRSRAALQGYRRSAHIEFVLQDEFTEMVGKLSNPQQSAYQITAANLLKVIANAKAGNEDDIKFIIIHLRGDKLIPVLSEAISDLRKGDMGVLGDAQIIVNVRPLAHSAGAAVAVS